MSSEPIIAPAARTAAEQADALLKRAAQEYVDAGERLTPVVRTLRDRAVRLLAEMGFQQHLAILKMAGKPAA